MSTQLLIYENIVPLSTERHAGWSVEVGADFAFTRNLNALPLLAAEFVAAGREYPIVFSKAGDTVQPVALLGMRGNENLFLSESSRWQAEYLPAFLRRYPFVFGRSEDGQTFTLCIDESFIGFNQTDRGEKLFNQDGRPTPYVTNVLEFLQNFQIEHARTHAFCKKLDEHELFQTQNAVWTGPIGEQATLSGFLVLSREKLQALPSKLIASMMGTGELDLIYAHLHSINNFNRFKTKLMAGMQAGSET